MTRREADEELLERLGGLRSLAPDAARLERIRARGHAALRERHARAQRRRSRARFAVRVVEPALVGGLSASYLIAILFVLLKLRGIL
jgi:hypothetical protein